MICIRRILPLFLLILLCACTQAPGTAPQKQSNTAQTPDAYQEIFEVFVDQVGVATELDILATLQQEKLSTISTTEIPFETYRQELSVLDEPLIPPSQIFCMSIASPEIDSLPVTLYFFPDNQYRYTLTEIRMGSENHYIAVSDSLHTTPVNYYTFAILGEPMRQNVQSSANLEQYLQSIPRLAAEYQQWIDSLEPLEVSFSVEPTADGFTLRSNLPDNAELHIDLYQSEKLIHQQTSILYDGMTSVTTDEPLDGDYLLQLNLPCPRDNYSMLYDVLGMNGEALRGEYVQIENGRNSVHAILSITF